VEVIQLSSALLASIGISIGLVWFSSCIVKSCLYMVVGLSLVLVSGHAVSYGGTDEEQPRLTEHHAAEIV